MNCALLKSASLLLRAKALIRLCVAAACWFIASGPAQAQTPYVLPPRNVDDILAVLEQYKPDPTLAERRRAAASRQPPAVADKVNLDPVSFPLST